MTLSTKTTETLTRICGAVTDPRIGPNLFRRVTNALDIFERSKFPTSRGIEAGLLRILDLAQASDADRAVIAALIASIKRGI